MEPNINTSTSAQGQPEEVIDKLDEEFRRILRFIKEQIPFINSNCHLTQYRLWLEKLSTSHMEKMERNMYLMELARQIQNNNLLPPFHQPPPSGSLKSLPKINHFCPSMSDICRNPDEVWPWDDPSLFCAEEMTFNPLPQEYIQSLHTLECSRNFPEFMHTSEPNCHTSMDNEAKLDVRSSSLQAVKMEMKASKGLGRKKNKQTNKTKSVHKINIDGNVHRCGERPNLSKLEEKILLKEDNSWCDLTDASVTSVGPLGCGDTEPNVSNKMEDDFEQSEDIFYSSEENKEATETQQEVSRLETVEELAEDTVDDAAYSKISLKDTNFIPADWKKTIESLQIRLTETLNQNNELKSIIDSLQFKLDEESANFKVELERQLRNASEEKTKEITVLKTHQMETVNELEKTFKTKLQEAERLFQENLDKAKSLYDVKASEMKKEHSQLLKDKEKEVVRLTNIIQQHCLRMANEVCELRSYIMKYSSSRKSSDEKIVVLQKCISKMDKLFQKSEMEYLESIEKLRQELDVKEKASQIQLRTQRAELITKATLEKQEEIEAIITSLEVKYVQMLEQHELHMAENKRQDEETIETLKKLLDEHGIPYDVD